MVGERLNLVGEVVNNSETAVGGRESGKKILEATMIPEKMTIEQYEAYLDGQMDRFGNPTYSATTKQNLLDKFAKGDLPAEETDPEAKTEAENAEKAQAEIANEKQDKLEGILAGRTPGEALTGIETELKELDWARWNLEQFLAAHVDTVSPEEAETYQKQLEMIAGRTAELNNNKSLIENELGTTEASLPEMGERAALEANSPMERDSSKLVTAMGRMLEKWRHKQNAEEPAMLATEPGAEPSAEEFAEGDNSNEVEESRLSQETHEQKETLINRVAEKLETRAPMKRFVAKTVLTLMAVTMLSGGPKMTAGADSREANKGGGRLKRVEADAGDQEVELGEALKQAGAYVVETGQDVLEQIKAAEGNVAVDKMSGFEVIDTVETAEQSFEDIMLEHGAELYEGFMEREGSEMDDFGVMGNYTEGWDLNKPGSNHFGPDLSEIVKKAVEEGRNPEEVLPELKQKILNIYRDQPECLMSYMASFPNLMQKIGVSSEITNIEDICDRTNALVDLLYSEQGGGDFQKRMLALADLTMNGEGADVELTQLYDYVETDYLKLKEGETESGLGHFDVKSQGKQRKGEWHVIFTFEGESATVNTNCGGQKTYVVVVQKRKTYSPTAVALVAQEEPKSEAVVMDTVQVQEETPMAETVNVEVESEQPAEESETSETPEASETPETPQTPETPETPEQPETPSEEKQDDSKDPDTAKNTLNEEKVTNGEATSTENVEEAEVDTTYEEVAPDENGSEEVIEESVEGEGEAEEQGEADQSSDENIESDDEELDAISEFTERLNNEGE